MNLRQLLPNEKIPFDCSISSITQDSRMVEKGTLFFCTKEGSEGKAYIQEAFDRGASVIAVPAGFAGDRMFQVENPRKAYSLACSRFWDEPARHMTLMGITGTNGKTSVAWMLRHILQESGYRTGLLSTVCCSFEDRTIPAHYTTPDAEQLYPLLYQMKEAGCQYVVMEASSQALAQERLAGLNFQCGVFTNLTRDHLDYHKTMGAYFEAKKQLLNQSSHWIVNGDDLYGASLRENKQCRVWSQKDETADYVLHDIQSDISGTRFTMKTPQEETEVFLPIPGAFSAENAAAALAAADSVGIPVKEGAKALKNYRGVPGRAQYMLTETGVSVIIDYAHTSDGMEKIEMMAKQMAPNHIYTVFGCAGERDRGDRLRMAQAAVRWSERVYFTQDNPRREPWEQICRDVLEAGGLELIPDREKAITKALSRCKKGDLLLLLGKGHEKYQVLQNRTIFLDEEEIVRRFR